MKWIFGGVPFWGDSQIVHVAKCHYFQNFFRFFCCNFENALIADAHFMAVPSIFFFGFVTSKFSWHFLAPTIYGVCTTCQL